MVKKTIVLTRPTPTCRDTSFRGTAAARSATRRIMSVTFADGCETVSTQCPTKLALFFNILLVDVKAGIKKVGQPLTGGRCLGGTLEDVLEVDRTT